MEPVSFIVTLSNNKSITTVLNSTVVTIPPPQLASIWILFSCWSLLEKKKITSFKFQFQLVGKVFFGGINLFSGFS